MEKIFIELMIFRKLQKVEQEDIWVVIDRLSINLEEENLNRMADSIQTAFFEGEGECTIEV